MKFTTQDRTAAFFVALDAYAGNDNHVPEGMEAIIKRCVAAALIYVESRPMKVYVVEHGVWDERGIRGVYESIDAAIAHNPISDQARKEYPNAEWHEGKYGWENGCDREELCRIYEFDLEGLA